MRKLLVLLLLLPGVALGQSALTGNAVQDTYGDLIHLCNSGAGVDATTRQMCDGLGSYAALGLSTTQLWVAELGIGDTAAAPDVVLSATGDTLTVDGDFTIGIGAVGVDYILKFDGETNDGTITFMEDEDEFHFDKAIELTGVGADASLLLNSSVSVLASSTNFWYVAGAPFLADGDNKNIIMGDEKIEYGAAWNVPEVFVGYYDPDASANSGDEGLCISDDDDSACDAPVFAERYFMGTGGSQWEASGAAIVARNNADSADATVVVNTIQTSGNVIRTTLNSTLGVNTGPSFAAPDIAVLMSNTHTIVDADSAGTSVALDISPTFNIEDDGDNNHGYTVIQSDVTETSVDADVVDYLIDMEVGSTDVFNVTSRGLISTSADGNNAALELVDLTNTNVPASGNTSDTVDISFNFTTDASAVVEGARISVYKEDDYEGAAGTQDSGFKLWVTAAGSPYEAVRIDENGWVSIQNLLDVGTIGSRSARLGNGGLFLGTSWDVFWSSTSDAIGTAHVQLTDRDPDATPNNGDEGLCVSDGDGGCDAPVFAESYTFGQTSPSMTAESAAVAFKGDGNNAALELVDLTNTNVAVSGETSDTVDISFNFTTDASAVVEGARISAIKVSDYEGAAGEQDGALKLWHVINGTTEASAIFGSSGAYLGRGANDAKFSSNEAVHKTGYPLQFSSTSSPDGTAHVDIRDYDPDSTPNNGDEGLCVSDGDGGCDAPLYAQSSHGELYGTPTITVTTGGTYYGSTALTQGLVTGAPFVSAHVADATSDHLIIGTGGAGNYYVNFTASFTGATLALVECHLYEDTTQDTKIHFHRTFPATPNIGSASFSGLVAFSATDEPNVRCTSDGNGDTIVFSAFNFAIYRMN
jgi:hypothetical protein